MPHCGQFPVICYETDSTRICTTPVVWTTNPTTESTSPKPSPEMVTKLNLFALSLPFDSKCINKTSKRKTKIRQRTRLRYSQFQNNQNWLCLYTTYVRFNNPSLDSIRTLKKIHHVAHLHTELFPYMVTFSENQIYPLEDSWKQVVWGSHTDVKRSSSEIFASPLSQGLSSSVSSVETWRQESELPVTKNEAQV